MTRRPPAKRKRRTWWVRVNRHDWLHRHVECFGLGQCDPKDRCRSLAVREVLPTRTAKRKGKK